jgi:hypothetical protein
LLVITGLIFGHQEFWERAMEKLKSWNALFNFPTTPAAIAGIYVLKFDWVLARIKNIPQGLKPSFILLCWWPG